MPNIQNKADFAAYCLRRLGSGVVKINISTDQVDDRIDDALAWMYDYHFDFTRKVYLKHLITATDVANNYVTMPDEVHSVSQVLPNSLAGNIGIWNQQFIMSLTDAARLDLLSYYMSMAHLQFVEQLITTVPRFEFQYFDNRVVFDAKTLGTRFAEGNFLVLETYMKIDPEVYTKMWANRSFHDLATAYIKKQWGNNLQKFGGVQLLGGVTLNGDKIAGDADAENTALKQDFMMRYQNTDLLEIG